MPATSLPEEQAVDREYPQRHRHQELGALQHNHNVAEFQSRLHCQQNQSSWSTLQHQTSQQDLRHSYPQSNTHLTVPSVPAAGSTSRSSSISPVPTPSISPPASAVSIDAPYSPRDYSPPVPTPSSTGTEVYGGHPQRDSYDRNSLGRHSQDNISLEPQGRNPANMASWSGQPAIRGSSEAVRMVLLSFVTIGITFTWGIEMTYCTPYLLNLGLTKSNTSLVWIAGPLSGLIVQPVVGVIADESFTREIVGFVVTDDEAAKRPTIVLAVLAIYVVDFAINAVMSCSKSLIVDTLPIDKQQAGAAWSSRMSAIGHMIAYGAGAVDLLKLFGTTLGDTQFKQLTVISTIALLSSTSLTCWAVTERVLVASKPAQHEGRFKVFRQIWATLLNLPPRIQAICWAQFWAWIGWFPFLFYSTTWVGETYFRYDVPADARKSKDTLGAIGRIGSTALVVYSVITFAGAWILPMFVQSPEDNSFTHRPPQAIAGFLTRFNKVKPDLLTAWMFGHIMFAASMSLAPFATSFRFATVLVCLCGIPWTLAMWAPSAFLGVEVNKLGGGAGSDGAYRRISDEPDIELSEISHDDAALQLDHGSEVGMPSTASTGELSGIYFGILNIYTTLPQFVGTFISTIVFAVLEPGKSPELAGDEKKQPDPDGPNAIAVCLFIGAMSSLVAAYVTRKLKVM
ncbi:related to sucrose transporter SUT1D [Fusarium fujikuroi]|nr:related to sucrose transporter SUT1D [Fusarium fujikuroi]SCN71663.1 related to sucrose transporter SUT1D [Fusarium fujikuroi]SCN75891.1 related to sucrose transporter SUT1D [Fusarium fujikuroi]SCO30080.1 related to sucrose transporter SUT1D [Fusarium fujikuroi]